MFLYTFYWGLASAIFVYLSLHKNKTHSLLKQVKSDVDLLKVWKNFCKPIVMVALQFLETNSIL